MWQSLLILYFVFGATSYLLRRILAQRLGSYNKLINAVFFAFFLLPGIFIIAPFFPHNLDIGGLNILLLLLGSLIFPLGNIIAFEANKRVEVGIFTIINSVSPVFTITLATLLLQESLSTLQLWGAGLLILSGSLAAFSQLQKAGKTSLHALSLCLLSAILIGVAIVYERFMLTRIDFGAYLVYGWGSQIVWAVILARRELSKLPELFSKKLGARRILLVWGAASLLKSLSFILALKIGTASLVGTASNFLSAVVVVSAYIFLKERKQLAYKIVAVTIGICGLLLIAT